MSKRLPSTHNKKMKTWLPARLRQRIEGVIAA